MRLHVFVLAALSLVTYSFAAPAFYTNFADVQNVLEDKWIHSTDEKYSGKFEVAIPKDLTTPALKVPEKARHYGITALLAQPLDPAGGLVLQYDLKLEDGLTCGGAYLKFLTATPDFEAHHLVDTTPYSVMFGPDKCGSTNKVHLILRHIAPDGTIEEKHLKSPPSLPYSEGTHVYTAVLRPDNTFEVLIDGEVKSSGSLLEDFTPAINPAEEIDDPEDTKPEDWVDLAKIQDPEAVKPDDWDEDAPATIPDPEAEKPQGWLDDEPLEVADPDASPPEDWDEEEDGTWEAPLVRNPACAAAPGCGTWKAATVPNPAFKGKWRAPLIDNPEYKGEWAPAKIPNPGYFKDDTPLASIGKIGAVAIEIWTMDSGIFFDNVLVDTDPAVAQQLRDSTWEPKKAAEAEAKAAADAAKAAAAPDEDPDVSALDRALARFNGALTNVVALPALAPVAPFLGPAVQFLSDTREAAIAVLLAGVLLALLLVWSVLKRVLGLGKGRGKPSARAAKKEDVTEEDDDEEEEEEGEEEDTPAASSEIQEEKEDKPKPAPSTRQRPRREN